jgi:hypothetical protein
MAFRWDVTLAIRDNSLLRSNSTVFGANLKFKLEARLLEPAAFEAMRS